MGGYWPDAVSSPGGYSGGAVWDTTPVIDPKRNSVYVGTGNNYSVPADVAACFAANNNNPSCTADADYFDSVVALDLTTGNVKWATRALFYDAWNVDCIFVAPGTDNCPNPAGPDYDFGGAGPNLLSVAGGDVIGIGEKSGIYWALNPDSGAVIWHTQVGPGSTLGGIEWGTAYDGTRIYAPIANLNRSSYTLPNGTSANGGSWAALDPVAGKILWQTPVPGGYMGLGPASVGNGVVFVGSMDNTPTPNPNPTMFALNAATGAILWQYAPGSSVNAAPAIVGNMIFWGSGYGHFGSFLGTGNNKLFAFIAGDANTQ